MCFVRQFWFVRFVHQEHRENDRAHAPRGARRLREHPREPAAMRTQRDLRASRKEPRVRGARRLESRGANIWRASRREAVRGPKRKNVNRNETRSAETAETHAQAAERLGQQVLPLQKPPR